jgi:hypothetical protein
MMTEGCVVQLRREVGVIKSVLASGHAYRVQMTTGETYVCLGSVLREAPPNVTVFRALAQEVKP